MQRLFIGVNFSDEEKDYFAQKQKILKKYCDRGHYTRPENFHLTLKFLGLMPQNVVGRLVEMINNLSIKELCLCAEHIGFFSKKQGYIVYLGFRPQSKLNQLTLDLNVALMEARLIERDLSDYTPHITLCRNAHFSWPLVDISKEITIKKELRVTNLTLYESFNIGGLLTYCPLYIREVI